MLVTQFDKFVNRSTMEILGSEITKEDLSPMISTELRENVILSDLIATQNGLYIPPQGVDGFRQVLVNVPNTYTNSDEGKVVENGSLISQTSRPSDITQNGIYETTLYNSINVNVATDINNIQYHLGQLKIDTGVITENNNYCYSDLIPIPNANGQWFLDLTRTDVNSYYIGLAFYGSDQETILAFIRQYQTYRSYFNTSSDDIRYFRVANLVSNQSFASVVFCGANLHIANHNSTIYKINPGV